MEVFARENLAVTGVAAREPAIGQVLWMLEETRGRTLDAVAGLDSDILEWEPPFEGNSIASLLYHIPAIEADWLYVEVLQAESFHKELIPFFPVDVTEPDGHLARWRGESLQALRERLRSVRLELLDAFTTMSFEDYCDPRSLPEYDVTPEWVLYHLLQHENEHLGEIGVVKQLALAALRS